jgi:hypothetical protein
MGSLSPFDGTTDDGRHLLSSVHDKTRASLPKPRTRVQASRHALRPGRLATDLLLDDRFDWPRRGDWIGVSMHHLPGPLFWPEDRRHPQRVWGDVVPVP